MTQRFYDLSGPNVTNGGILFAATTSGSGGAKASCDLGMNTARYCQESVLNNPLTWPQAVTGYKLNAETVDSVKDTIATWRSSEEGHLPSLTWVYNGGDTENGGSEYGVWGHLSVGLLVSKVVLCEDIPDRIMYYRYPEDVAVGDYVDPETNITIAEEIYNWWTNTCGYVDGVQVCGPYVPPEPTCEPWCTDCAPCQACVGFMEMDECADCKPCSPCEVCWDEEGSGDETDEEPTGTDEASEAEPNETSLAETKEDSACEPWCKDCAPCQACVGFMEMDECADCKPCSPCEVCWDEEGSGDETDNETSLAETKEDSAAYLLTGHSRILTLASSLSLALLVYVNVV